MQDLQVNSGPRFAHRGSSQQAPTSSHGAAPTEIHDGTSAKGTPDVGLQDPAGGEASGPEGSMGPPSSPSWATTIPDGCDDGAAVGIGQVGISQSYPTGILILQRCMADGLSPQAVTSLRRCVWLPMLPVTGDLAVLAAVKYVPGRGLAQNASTPYS